MSQNQGFAVSHRAPLLRERVIACAAPSLSTLELLVSGLALAVVLLLIVDIPTAGAT